jgi:DHA1 family bicyclomycin/chloramphenicol resistance-like MFS transporter
LDVRGAVFFMTATRVRDVSTLLLGALAFLAPFAVDVSLPGLPEIATAMRAPGGLVQWTLSAYVFATGLGQLAWGPISDTYGRRPVVLIGLAMYVVSAFACAAVHDVTTLIVLRFVQGIGACAGLSCAAAIVQDLPLPEHERVSRLAKIESVINVGPLVAPVAGVAVLAAFGWRALYVAPAILGVLAFIAIVVLLWETAERTTSSPLERYRRVLALPRTIPYGLTVFMLFAGYFAMIGGSSFALVDQLHLTTTAFAGAFTLEALCALIGSFAASRLAHRIDPGPLLGVAIGIAIAAGIANGVTGIAFISPVAFVATMSVYALAFGVALPSAFALVLAESGPDAGVAAGVIGAMLSFGGAAGNALSGALPFAPTVAIGGVTAAAACAAALSYLASRRAQTVASDPSPNALG